MTSKSATAKPTAADNPGLQDDHDPSDIGQKSANRKRNGEARKSVPHRADDGKTDTKTQTPETPPDIDSLGGGSQGGM